MAGEVEGAAPWGVQEAAREQGMTLAGPDSAGIEVRIHSRYRPREEARQWVDAVRRPITGSYVLFGVGLGYGVAALLEACPRAVQVFAYEANPGILRRALALHDWAEAIRARRLVLLTGRDRAAFYAGLEPDTVGLFLGTALASWAPAERVDPAAYRWAREALGDFFQHGRMSILTAAALAAVSRLNLAANLADYLAWPGLDDLAGAWAGKPALIVSAGPSLARHYDLLPRIQGRFAVIAVDTVFRTLLSLGVRPDFVTALDYSSIARKYFEGLPADAATTLVCDPRVNWTLLDEYRGPRRFMHNPYVDALLGEAAPPRASIPPGATVAHLAFHLAEYLGADPIVLVGQDLSYPYGTTHAPGNPIHLHWAPECNPYQTLEMKEWEEILRMRNRLRKVPGHDGTPVYTDDQMFSYLQRFVSVFARTRSRVWNATEGGAAIEGAEALPLREVLDRLTGDPGDKPWRHPPRGTLAGDLRSRALREVASRREELTAMRGHVETAHEALRRVRDLYGDRAEVSRSVRAAREAGERVQNSPVFRLVADLAQADEYRRLRRDRSRALMDLAGEDLQRAELARDLEYVAGIGSAAALLSRLLEVAESRLAAWPARPALTSETAGIGV